MSLLPTHTKKGQVRRLPALETTRLLKQSKLPHFEGADLVVVHAKHPDTTVVTVVHSNRGARILRFVPLDMLQRSSFAVCAFISATNALFLFCLVLFLLAPSNRMRAVMYEVFPLAVIVATLLSYLYGYGAEMSGVSTVTTPHEATLVLRKSHSWGSSLKVSLKQVRQFRVASKHTVFSLGRFLRWSRTVYAVEVVTLGPAMFFAAGDEAETVDVARRLNTFLTDLRQNTESSSPPLAIISCDDDMHSVAIRTITQTSPLVTSAPVGVKHTHHSDHRASLIWPKFRARPRRTLVTIAVGLAAYVVMLVVAEMLHVHVHAAFHLGIVSWKTMKGIVAPVVGVLTTMQGGLSTLLAILFLIAGHLQHMAKEKLELSSEEVRKHSDLWLVAGTRCKVGDVGRVQLCRQARDSISFFKENRLSGQDVLGGRRFALRLMSQKYEVLLAVEQLTEGEALFIAHQLKQRYPQMFQRGSDESSVENLRWQ